MLFLKYAAKQGPAVVVIPVLIPMQSLCPSLLKINNFYLTNLFVFSQVTALATLFKFTILHVYC
jgi:hypothetical protein